MSRLIKSTILVTLLAVCNVVVNFAVEVLLAGNFGASFKMDSFLAAITVPEFIVTIILTAITVAFVPTLTDLIARKKRDLAYNIVNSYLISGALVLCFLVILGIIFSHSLISLVVSGFDEQKINLASNLMMIYFPMVLFRGSYVILAAIFYSERRFFIPSVAPFGGALINLLTIVLLAPKIDIYAAALGMIFSSIFQFSLLFSIYVKEKKFKLSLDLSNEYYLKILKLMIPLFCGAVFYKSVFIVDRYIASSLAQGSISYLGYASKITKVLITVGTSGIVIATFPVISKYIAELKWQKIQYLVLQSMTTVFYMTVFIFTMLIILGQPLVKIFFERGQFFTNDTLQVAKALIYYGGVLIFGALGAFTTNLFYAFKDTKTPVLVGIFGFAIGLILKLVFSRYLSYIGIALASSIYYGLNFFIMVYILQKKYRILNVRKLFNQSIKILFCALATLTLFLTVNAKLPFDFSYSWVIIQGFAVCLFFVFISKLLNLEPLTILINKISSLKVKLT